MNKMKKTTQVQKIYDAYLGFFLAAAISKILIPLLKEEHVNPFYNWSFASFWKMIEDSSIPIYTHKHVFPSGEKSETKSDS